MRTLRDLQGDSHAEHGHDDDDDEDQDFFAGGEKSGLAVQNPGNPRDEIESILDRARRWVVSGANSRSTRILTYHRNIPRPGGDDDEQPHSRFTGRGVTLGGEGTESRVIDDPRANISRPPPRVQRILHLWVDGFSVDDGPLFRYDDPANAATLAMINQGRAPLELLNVEHNQEVDLQLDNQKDTKYVQPKKKYKPFSGTGQRLGSPTPGASARPSASSGQQPATAASSSTASTTGVTAPSVNESQPTVTLQIRLGDGTQLRSRFNTTHTIGDVYAFVNAASPISSRAYVLMTTFPSKELTEKGQALIDTELKRGGVVVQKWV
jgi:UBX domain-containing protein 1